MDATGWRLVPKGETGGVAIHLRGSRLTVGRRDGQDVCIGNPGVSREHAILARHGGAWTVRDLGSSQGTKVNGSLVQPGADIALEDGTTIEFGPCLYKLEESGGASQSLRTISEGDAPDGDIHAIDTDVSKLKDQMTFVLKLNERLAEARTVDAIWETALDALQSATGFRNVACLTGTQSDGTLLPVAARGDIVRGGQVRVSGTLMQKAEQTQLPFAWDRRASREELSRSIAENRLEQVCIAPVRHRDRRYGYLVMDSRGEGVARLESDVAGVLLWLVALTVGGRLDVVQEMSDRLRAERERSLLFEGALRSLVNFVEEKDVYTRQHSLRVATIAELIARHAGWDEERRERVLLAGRVHDIGKVITRQEVLTKPGKLTDEEFGEIKAHPETGYKILNGAFGWHEDVLHAIRHHHEKWSGAGYPHGLRGEEIPLFARLLAFADVFDALTSARSYRAAMTTSLALEIMRKDIGTHFDPELAAVFFAIPIEELEACRAGGEWETAKPPDATPTA